MNVLNERPFHLTRGSLKRRLIVTAVFYLDIIKTVTYEQVQKKKYGGDKKKIRKGSTKAL